MFNKIKRFMKIKKLESRISKLEKTQDEKIKDYLENISINHPEIENFGLNCDTKLYVDFNKEKLIRQFVGFERLIQNKMSEVCGINVPYNESEPSEAERFYAQCKILVFVDMGILNKENLEVIKNMEVLV